MLMLVDIVIGAHTLVRPYGGTLINLTFKSDYATTSGGWWLSGWLVGG